MRRFLSCLLLFGLLLLQLAACGGRSPVRGLTPKTLQWGVGTLPKAEDFFDALPEGCSARFDGDYDYTRLGEHTRRVILSDERGRECSYEVRVVLVLDEEPPVMTGVKDLSITLGESVAYRASVTLSDNCDGPVTLEVDRSAVNLDRVGSYPVTYTAIDASGNRTSRTVTLYVYESKVSEAELYAELDAVIARIIRPGMTREEQARAVHRYVYDSITYASTSDKSDWVREAYNALFLTGRGDCFSYFAASKAFLTRLGIAHMDIQRTPGIVDETHYWHLVNVGSAEDPRWYHFDATHLLNYSYSGCLLTDAQIADYNERRYAADGVTNRYFYAYDVAAYPKSASEVITPH